VGSKPESIGKFRINRELGRGAMGVVYDATDQVLERRVAIKTVTLTGEDRAYMVECLKREAKAIAGLEHQRIVTLYDAFELSAVYYLVLQYVEGITLFQCLQHRGTVPVDEAVTITLQLLEALGYAHGRGVVHRDVKPSNVMIAADGVKLMDFGIARPLGTGLTTSGLVMGTLGYMSPEQFLGHPIDGRSDIFSTGCLLHEMLAGRRLFREAGFEAIAHQLLRAPSPMIPSLDPPLQAVLAKSMAKKPDDRFQSCAEFASALERVMARQSLRQGLPSKRMGTPFPLLLLLLVSGVTSSSGGHRPAKQWEVPSILIPAVPASPMIPDPRAAMIPVLKPVVEIPPAVVTLPLRQPLQAKSPFDALIVAGDKAFQLGRYEEALDRYTEAARLEPMRPLAQEKRKLALTVLGRGEELFRR